MTITATVFGLEDTTNVADVDVRQIASSEWSERRGAFSSGNGSVGVVYVNNTTPLDAEMTLIVSCRTAPREAEIGVRHYTVALGMKISLENSVSGEIVTYPVKASVSLDIPMSSGFTVTHLSYVVQNLFGVLFPSASSGVIATTALAKVLSGVPSLY